MLYASWLAIDCKVVSPDTQTDILECVPVRESLVTALAMISVVVEGPHMSFCMDRAGECHGA